MWQDAEFTKDDAWLALYDAADAFLALAPWRWLRETDVFAVRHPSSGTLVRCGVLGHGGSSPGLSVCIGSGGCDGLIRLHSNSVAAGHSLDLLEESLLQHGLSLTFSDDHEPDARDEHLETRLARARSDQGALIPRFRSHEPGCEPWYLTRDEVTFLEAVITQTLKIAHRARRSPDMLVSPAERVLFARTYDLTLHGLAWRDAWVSIPHRPANDNFEIELDTVRLDALRSLPSAANDHADGKASAGTWEVDFVISPSAASAGPRTRPTHPYLLLVVDQPTGLVLQRDMADHEDRHQALRELVLRTMEAEGRKPESIWVRREGVADSFFTLAECLDIELEFVPSLIALDSRRIRLGSTSDGREAAELGVGRQ